MSKDVVTPNRGIPGEPIDPEAVYDALGSPAVQEQLAAMLAMRHPYRYRASHSNPGFLEQVDADGVVVVGRSTDGQFHPRDAEL